MSASSALPFTHLGLSTEIAAAASRARTRPIRTMKQWALDELIIPTGPVAMERFRVERQPVQGLLLDEFDSGNWVEKYISGTTQSGKSYAGFFLPIAYHLAEIGEDVIAAVPDMKMADAKWQNDLLTAFQTSPTLRRLLPERGAGSVDGGTVKDAIRFNNGTFLKWMSKGGSDQAKAGITARVVAVTEAAGFSVSSETSVEAEPLKQVEARQRAWDYPARCTYVEGTLTVENQLPWSAREDSSRSRIVSPCPHCGAWISPQRHHLVGWQDAETEFAAEDNARWQCPSCKELIDDDQRKESLLDCKIIHGEQTIDRRGNVIGDLPRTRRLWFHWQSWHNLFVSTSSLGKEEWEASRKPEDSQERQSAERELCQFIHSVPYVPMNLDVKELDPKQVANRKSIMPRGTLPADTQFVTIGIDLGKYTGHWFGMAFCRSGKIHCFDFGTFEIHSDTLPTVEEAIIAALKEFHAAINPGWMIQETGEIKQADQIWIDAGWQPDAVFKFVKSLGKHSAKASRYFPVIGRGTGQMMRIYEAPKSAGGRIVQVGKRWHVSQVQKYFAYEIMSDVDFWKEELHNHLQLDANAPGALNFFSATARDLKNISSHLTNEKRVQEFVPGKGLVLKWVKIGQQHWLDSAAYARAAGDRCGWRPPAREDATATTPG